MSEPSPESVKVERERLEQQLEGLLRAWRDTGHSYAGIMQSILGMIDAATARERERIAKKSPSNMQLLALELLSGAGPQPRSVYVAAYQAIMEEAIRSPARQECDDGI